MFLGQMVLNQTLDISMVVPQVSILAPVSFSLCLKNIWKDLQTAKLNPFHGCVQ